MVPRNPGPSGRGGCQGWFLFCRGLAAGPAPAVGFCLSAEGVLIIESDENADNAPDASPLFWGDTQGGETRRQVPKGGDCRPGLRQASELDFPLRAGWSQITWISMPDNVCF